MKKWLLPLLAVVFFAPYSCTKDKADKPIPIVCTGLSTDSLTYDITVKGILDFYCAYSGCHDHASAGLSANVDMEGYDAAKASFENKPVLCSIKHESGCLPMPQGFPPKLADSLITYLQCWAENGYAR